MPDQATRRRERKRVGHGDDTDPRAAERLPSIRHKPSHCPQHENRAEIIGKVNDIKTGCGGGRIGLEFAPEGFRLRNGQGEAGDGTVELEL